MLQQHAIVLIQGGPGTGKTTFARHYFSEYAYISLKDKKHRHLLERDPHRFFKLYADKTIFDDIEEIPGFATLLTSYSLSIYQLGNYILISNVKLEADSSFIHSCRFFPMDLQEMKAAGRFHPNLETSCLQSALPDPQAYKNYLNRVFSGPLAKLIRVQQPELLFKVLRQCALQLDRPVNLNAIAKKTGVSQPTVQHWLKAFEDCGLIHFLYPLEESFCKRIIKSPKIYFGDCGLAAWLLKLKSSDELLRSPAFEALYANLVFLEILKKNTSQQNPRPLFFWKESNGHEIRFLLQNPTSYDIFDCVTAYEIGKKDLRELDFFDEISEGRVLSRNIVYGGFKNYARPDVNVLSWQAITA